MRVAGKCVQHVHKGTLAIVLRTKVLRGQGGCDVNVVGALPGYREHLLGVACHGASLRPCNFAGPAARPSGPTNPLRREEYFFRASSWHWREANDDGGRQRRRRRRRRALLRGRSDALLAQVRQLRESMQQESGVLQQKAQASEQERTSAQRNLGRTVASIVDDVANMPSLMVDVANGRGADAKLQPAPAAIGGARSVADGADGPSDANSQIEAELARRRGAAGAAQAQAQPPRGHGASSSPPPARPSPLSRHLRRGSRAQMPRAARRPASRPSRVAPRPPVPTTSPRSRRARRAGHRRRRL